MSVFSWIYLCPSSVFASRARSYRANFVGASPAREFPSVLIVVLSTGLHYSLLILNQRVLHDFRSPESLQKLPDSRRTH